MTTKRPYIRVEVLDRELAELARRDPRVVARRRAGERVSPRAEEDIVRAALILGVPLPPSTTPREPVNGT